MDILPREIRYSLMQWSLGGKGNESKLTNICVDVVNFVALKLKGILGSQNTAQAEKTECVWNDDERVLLDDLKRSVKHVISLITYNKAIFDASSKLNDALAALWSAVLDVIFVGNIGRSELEESEIENSLGALVYSLRGSIDPFMDAFLQCEYSDSPSGNALITAIVRKTRDILKCGKDSSVSAGSFVRGMLVYHKVGRTIGFGRKVEKSLKKVLLRRCTSPVEIFDWIKMHCENVQPNLTSLKDLSAFFDQSIMTIEICDHLLAALAGIQGSDDAGSKSWTVENGDEVPVSNGQHGNEHSEEAELRLETTHSCNNTDTEESGNTVVCLGSQITDTSHHREDPIPEDLPQIASPAVIATDEEARIQIPDLTTEEFCTTDITNTDDALDQQRQNEPMESDFTALRPSRQRNPSKVSEEDGLSQPTPRKRRTSKLSDTPHNNGQPTRSIASSAKRRENRRPEMDVLASADQCSQLSIRSTSKRGSSHNRSSPTLIHTPPVQPPQSNKSVGSPPSRRRSSQPTNAVAMCTKESYILLDRNLPVSNTPSTRPSPRTAKHSIAALQSPTTTPKNVSPKVASSAKNGTPESASRKSSSGIRENRRADNRKSGSSSVRKSGGDKKGNTFVTPTPSKRRRRGADDEIAATGLRDYSIMTPRYNMRMRRKRLSR